MQTVPDPWPGQVSDWQLLLQFNLFRHLMQEKQNAATFQPSECHRKYAE